MAASGEPQAIDWGTAQRIGELIAGSPPRGSASAGAAQELAHDFARRVSAYTKLELPAELPPLELVDRPSWIAANLATMRPLVDPLAQRFGGDWDGLLAGPTRSATGHLLGAQLGALAGLLSQRVLGQYDISLLEDATPPRLLLLAPNLVAAARNLSVDREQLSTWVAIHEITHAVQFSGAPWLRGHLGAMLRELIDTLQPSSDEDERNERAPTGKRAALRLPDPGELLDRARQGELRSLIERARHGELLQLGLGAERWALIERMQATMSLIEGHAEHTMDAVGAELLPSLPKLRAAMNRRRAARGLPWRVLERLLGLELKMRQYQVGRSFCDAIVKAGGPEALALAWRSPAELPTQAELTDPASWLARVWIAAA